MFDDDQSPHDENDQSDEPDTERTPVPLRPAKRFERRCRTAAFPFTLLVNVKDLCVGEILITLSECDYSKELYERIVSIDSVSNYVQVRDENGDISGQSQISNDREWHILDVPREGSIWSYVDRKMLRVTEVHGTCPEDVLIHYSYVETLENGIVTLEQWQAWHYASDLRETDG